MKEQTQSREDAFRRAGQLMVLLERHLDRAAGEEEGAAEETGRAWVRAAQLERLLREQLPPGATDGVDITDTDAHESPSDDAPANDAPADGTPATGA